MTEVGYWQDDKFDRWEKARRLGDGRNIMPDLQTAGIFGTFQGKGQGEFFSFPAVSRGGGRMNRKLQKQELVGS